MTDTPPRARGLPVGAVVAIAVVVGWAAPVAVYAEVHGHLNVHQVALAFFFWLNAIIAFWELCLFRHIDDIAAQVAAWGDRYRGRELDRVVAFFGAPMSLADVFSTRRWSEVWSSYAVYDPSYADRRSFGFTIDIGNGFTTLLPSLFLAWGMTWQPLPPRLFALIGIVASYQMLYGTILYFTSFVLNRRHVGLSRGQLAAFVGVSNGIWLVFPVWAIAVFVRMLMTGSWAVLR
ncbi:MAG: hypothetical protein H6733_15060 [Alphaproteobacteria bacterium]|nr:hypothetical protein [Alphaproteobacteria bacterium]